MHQPTESSILEIAKNFVLHTSQHVFLTGRAGTGKTTFLRFVKENTAKNFAILAPTGVAAINAGGVTIHSFFQLPFGSFIPVQARGFSAISNVTFDRSALLSNLRLNKQKRRLIEELELLVIDEVSMVRADLLDAMDHILRHIRRKPELPFGGVQMLFIGDLFQLPPVVKDEEWAIMNPYYRSLFFFDAVVMSQAYCVTIELDKIYRQSDQRFIELLNHVRNNMVTEEDFLLLQKHYDPDFRPDPEEGYIILTSHNFKADKINQEALRRLQNEPHQYLGNLSGDFNENALPVDKELMLKVGTQIMFIKNDKGENRRYYNGKIGTISRIHGEDINIKFPNDPEELKLEKETWKNIRYQYNELADTIEEQVLGSYTQYPIRLAWAVTIHKSQGLTFERAIVDAGQSFAPGQVYVALSRLTSLSGLVLASPITSAAIHTEHRITDFINNKTSTEALIPILKEAQQHYLTNKLFAAFNWDRLLLYYKEHFDNYGSIRLPHHAESLKWCIDMIDEIVVLKDFSDKFLHELNWLLAPQNHENFQRLFERVQSATSYFIKAITDKLIAPWQIHFDETKIKTKTKKYLKSLQPLYTLLLRKKQQMEQATILAEGLATGKNIHHLLEHFQNTHKNIPAVLLYQEAPSSLKINADTKENKPAPVTKLKPESTKTISLKMFLEGKDIASIAAARNLALSTIEGHLLNFISSGEVLLNQLVSPEKEMVIRAAINKAPNEKSGVIREITGEACSFTEIKAVMAQVEAEKQETKREVEKTEL
ncbi:MAG: helix-turn-helix domain-containing protein [Bacteroidetes bacterium]|nr:helix-turn-helix domain-containing protein [Bacteroidota bacterium]